MSSDLSHLHSVITTTPINVDELSTVCRTLNKLYAAGDGQAVDDEFVNTVVDVIGDEHVDGGVQLKLVTLLFNVASSRKFSNPITTAERLSTISMDALHARDHIASGRLVGVLYTMALHETDKCHAYLPLEYCAAVIRNSHKTPDNTDDFTFHYLCLELAVSSSLYTHRLCDLLNTSLLEENESFVFISIMRVAMELLHSLNERSVCGDLIQYARELLVKRAEGYDDALTTTTVTQLPGSSTIDECHLDSLRLLTELCARASSNSDQSAFRSTVNDVIQGDLPVKCINTITRLMRDVKMNSEEGDDKTRPQFTSDSRVYKWLTECLSFIGYVHAQLDEDTVRLAFGACILTQHLDHWCPLLREQSTICIKAITYNNTKNQEIMEDILKNTHV